MITANAWAFTKVVSTDGVVRLKLGDGLFADRDKLIHQVVEHVGQLGISLRHHHQLETGAGTRSLRLHPGPHGLLGQPRQQGLLLMAFGRLGLGHRGPEIGHILGHHPIGHGTQQVRSSVEVEGRRAVSNTGATINPQMCQTARAVPAKSSIAASHSSRRRC